MHPEMDAMLLTPICPHSLTLRPLVVNSNSSIQITFPPYGGEIFITVDGQASCSLVPGDCVTVKAGPYKIPVVRSPSRGYYDVLTAKLNWGIQNRAY